MGPKNSPPKISKSEYDARDSTLRTELLRLQGELREQSFPVIIIVAGVEGAGKGEVVSALNRWFDPRDVDTHAFWDETDEETARPYFWRYWRKMPPKSTIGVFFGSWYSRPIIDRVYKRNSKADFAYQLDQIVNFERLLSDDGTLIIKFWFCLSKRAQKKQLKRDKRSGWVSPVLKRFAKHYERFHSISQTMLTSTDTPRSPWHIINAENARARNLAVGDIVTDVLSRRLRYQSPPAPTDAMPAVPHDTLASVDLTRSLPRDRYEDALQAAQIRLRELTWRAYRQGVNTVCVFEGWDAAGKGGAIRRLTAAIDPRLFRVIRIAAPSDIEHAQHYLWRFWRDLPRQGYCTIFDRSWYGRVLVERIENFCAKHEWQRAYREISDFEQQLHEHGAVVAKFWLHINPEEQLRRFNERAETPWKRHKITPEDWRNRDNWAAYERAVNDMVALTSTNSAPWHLVAANNKRFARVNVLETLCHMLETALR